MPECFSNSSFWLARASARPPLMSNQQRDLGVLREENCPRGRRGWERGLRVGKVGGLERESRQSGCPPLPGLQGFDCLIPKAFGVHTLSPVKSRLSMCSLGVPGRLWEPSLPPCLLLSPVHLRHNFLTCKFLSVVGIVFMGTSRLLISPACFAFHFPKATGQWLPCFCSIRGVGRAAVGAGTSKTCSRARTGIQKVLASRGMFVDVWCSFSLLQREPDGIYLSQFGSAGKGSSCLQKATGFWLRRVALLHANIFQAKPPLSLAP